MPQRLPSAACTQRTGALIHDLALGGLARAAFGKHGAIAEQWASVNSPKANAPKGKPVEGRKRHNVIETLGVVVSVALHPATVPDLRRSCTTRKSRPSPRPLFADGGHAGHGPPSASMREGDCPMKIDNRSDAVRSFEVLPWRRALKPNFACPGPSRRLAKDWEVLGVRRRCRSVDRSCPCSRQAIGAVSCRAAVSVGLPALHAETFGPYQDHDLAGGGVKKAPDPSRSVR
jgi:hypothetical protein